MTRFLKGQFTQKWICYCSPSCHFKPVWFTLFYRTQKEKMYAFDRRFCQRSAVFYLFLFVLFIKKWCYPKLLAFILYYIMLKLKIKYIYIFFFPHIILNKICWLIYFVSSYMEHSKNYKQTQLFNIFINLLHYITFLFHIKQSNLNEKQFIHYYIIFYIFYTLYYSYYIIKQYCIKTIYFPNVM